VKIKEAKKDYLIVDVRDDDFRGGNIRGAHNSPSATFHADVDRLVQDTKDTPVVVFHCMLSQQRGPKAARVCLGRADSCTSSCGCRSTPRRGTPCRQKARTRTTMYMSCEVGSAISRPSSGYVRHAFAQAGCMIVLAQDDPALLENYDAEGWKAGYFA
jgi:hypothetical protein